MADGPRRRRRREITEIVPSEVQVFQVGSDIHGVIDLREDRVIDLTDTRPQTHRLALSGRLGTGKTQSVTAATDTQGMTSSNGESMANKLGGPKIVLRGPGSAAWLEDAIAETEQRGKELREAKKAGVPPRKRRRAG